MKAHYVNVRKENYAIFEMKHKKNTFTEMFVISSLEDYEAQEENLDGTTELFVKHLEQLVEPDGMKYNTLVEAV